jgi:hypothetical protein
MLPLDQLLPLMRLCGTSPTSDQLEQYERMLDKNMFTFGDFLDVLATHRNTGKEENMEKLLYRFFAHHDENIGTENEGFMSIQLLKKLLCSSEKDSISEHSLLQFLERNGISIHNDTISITQFMELFGMESQQRLER